VVTRPPDIVVPPTSTPMIAPMVTVLFGVNRFYRDPRNARASRSSGRLPSPRSASETS
jgi:hypothetical protein